MADKVFKTVHQMIQRSSFAYSVSPSVLVPLFKHSASRPLCVPATTTIFSPFLLDPHLGSQELHS